MDMKDIEIDWLRDKNRNTERSGECLYVKDIEIDWLRETKIEIQKEPEREWK